METEYALSIVVPVYNSASTLPELVDRIAELPIDGKYELILVNDGSRDESAAVCKQLATEGKLPITFVNLSRNFGEHNAVMAGLKQARGQYVINIDDDFQNPPEEIVQLLTYARDGGYDVVYTKFATRRDAGWRKLGSWFTNRMADMLLDKPKGLYLSSFRCLGALVVRHICEYEGAFPYIDGLVLQVTQNIGVIEVQHAERREGESGYTLRRLVRLWSNMFINFSITPLRISTGLGLMLAGIGFLGTVWVVIEHFIRENPAGWGSVMCGLFIFSGMQLIILGLVGEYLGRVYLNANKRPQFVVREVVMGEARHQQPTSDGAPSREGSEAST